MMTRCAVAVRFSGGRLLFEDRADFDRAVRAMREGPGTLTLSTGTRRRSLSQNAYWWAVVVPALAEHCGYTPTQMHYALLGECFGYVDVPKASRWPQLVVPVKPSSSDLTVDEFTHLIEWVLTWAPTELGVDLPEPTSVSLTTVSGAWHR